MEAEQITLSDVLKFRRDAEQTMGLFGAMPALLDELRARLRSLGETFCKERGVSPHEAKTLPYDTPLGPIAGEQFLDLKRWFIANCNCFP